MNIIIFGPPGVGKGSQAMLLKAKYDLMHISTGEILREEVRNQTELGIKVKSIMDKGKLVSDDIVVGLIVKQIETSIDKNGFILDGFPRNITQAETLDKLLEGLSVKIDHVLRLESDKEIILKRLAGRCYCDKCRKDYNIYFNQPEIEGKCDICDGKIIQRSDNNEKVHLDRLDVYSKETNPLKKYYAQKDLLRVVDGMGLIKEVFERVKKVLES